MSLPVLNAFWIGPRLGPFHVACLHSLLKVGHEVVLHAYDPPEDLPAGVRLADAEKTLPRSSVFRHANGSYGVFADIFRYELLAAGCGLYVDCDVFCIQPIEQSDYVYGWLTDAALGNGVIGLPPDEPLLKDLREIRDGFIPPWYSAKKRLRLKALKLVGRPVSLAEMKWAATGPHAFTWFAKHHRKLHFALPVDVLNPVHFNDFRRLFDPRVKLLELITPRTRAIHLYNNAIRRENITDAPRGSPLAHLMASVQ